MRRNKHGIFAATAALTILAALAIRDQFHIKMPKKTRNALEDGMLIAENHHRVLAISAHPDDLEFFAGGLLRTMQLQDCEIYIIDITNGEKGVRLKNLVQMRRKEQLAAGKELGISNIHFLQLPDLKLDQINGLDSIIKQHIQEIKPDIILTFDYCKPIKVIKHPDHIMVGKCTREAAMQLMDKKPDILYYASQEPNIIVDITGCINEKINAVLQHRSQIRFSIKPYAFFVKIFGRYNSLHSGIKFAESFRHERFNGEH